MAGSSSPPPEHILSRALAYLGPVVESLGYRVVLERYDHEAFGSGLVLYGREQDQLRVVWDGRDEALWAERRAEPGEWSDIESTPSGGPRLLDKAQDLARLVRLARAIELSVGRPTTR
jgi:hypothetical protein